MWGENFPIVAWLQLDMCGMICTKTKQKIWTQEFWTYPFINDKIAYKSVSG